MVCADDGPDLRKGIKEFCKKHRVGRVFDTIHKIGTFLNGLSSKTGDNVEELLLKVTRGLPFDVIACEYAGKIIDFLKEQSKLVPLNQIWIGSSEIIESLFGKLKCLEQNQHKGGFTSLVLGMAACAGSIEPHIVEEAMLRIKTKDVEAWAKDQIGATVLSKRRKAFGTGRKYKVKKIKQESGGTTLEKAVGF